MAQTSRCPLHGGSYKPPLGVCAIYSQSILYIYIAIYIYIHMFFLLERLVPLVVDTAAVPRSANRAARVAELLVEHDTCLLGKKKLGSFLSKFTIEHPHMKPTPDIDSWSTRNISYICLCFMAARIAGPDMGQATWFGGSRIEPTPTSYAKQPCMLLYTNIGGG